jgi:hypothetical protein
VEILYNEAVKKGPAKMLKPKLERPKSSKVMLGKEFRDTGRKKDRIGSAGNQRKVSGNRKNS